MATGTDLVLDAALKLSREQRTEVVEQLLQSLDDEEDLLDEDRERLHAAITRSDEQFRAGAGVPANAVLDRLAKR